MILHFPLVRIAVFFICGIVTAYRINFTPLQALLPIAISLVILLSLRWRFRRYSVVSLSLFATVYFCGILTYVAHTPKNDIRHYIHSAETKKFRAIEITLRERLKKTAAGERFVAQVNSLDEKPATGKLLIYFKNFDSIPAIGTTVTAISSIIPNRKPKNPGQFDYGKYLADKGIYASAYLTPASILYVGKIEKDYWYYADRFRFRIISTLIAEGFGKRELQVAHALILGQQQDIDPDILHDYQYAGAVHILSVSGLHVGFLLVFFNLILKPLPNHARGRFLKLALILTGLWLFAIVAGLSPSVVRSATMFSIMAVAMAISRSSNPIHTLIVSALLILVFSPGFLFDVGFQLSYAALFFILWLQPRFEKFWRPENRIIRYFWNILSVSLAAQLGTVPLSLYYFHQFPGLFFITNLIVLPLLSVIMIAGVVVMVLASFEYVNAILMRILEWLIFLMNEAIAAVASVEAFVVRDIPVNAPIMVAGYALIFGVIIWLIHPRKSTLYLGMASILVFQGALLSAKIFSESQSELVVFQVPRKTAIALRNGKNAVLFADSTLDKNPIRNYLIDGFCKSATEKPIAPLFTFGNKMCIVLDSTVTTIGNLKPDFVILTKSPRINLDRLLNNHEPRFIIADGSNYKSYIKRWKSTCDKQKIPFHSTAETGFICLK